MASGRGGDLDGGNAPGGTPRSVGPGPRGRLDPAARRRIGQGLRALYADVLSAPVPVRFEALLTALAARPGCKEPAR